MTHLENVSAPAGGWTSHADVPWNCQATEPTEKALYNAGSELAAATAALRNEEGEPHNTQPVLHNLAYLNSALQTLAQELRHNLEDRFQTDHPNASQWERDHASKYLEPLSAIADAAEISWMHARLALREYQAQSCEPPPNEPSNTPTT